MIHEIIHLKDFYNINYDTTIETLITNNLWVPLKRKRKAILILPGGAYHEHQCSEADPIFIEFSAKNYQCFILRYSIVENNNYHKHPSPTLDLMSAMDFINKNRDKYQVEEGKIAIMGFSAGGHLAATYGYLYRNKKLQDLLKVEEKNIKPNALILSYPIITSFKYTHSESINNLVHNDESLYDEVSVEKHVDNNYPITFIWTTKEDTIVPYENTLIMDDVLTKNNVLHKTIIYPHGEHGQSLSTEVTSIYKEYIHTDVSNWVNECDKFLKENL